MDDLLYKGHFKGLDIAFTYTVATSAVNEAVLRHDCDPVAAHILGRAMTGALLAAAVLPEGHRLNVYWKYHGALKTIVVDAGRDGAVRGFVSPRQLGGSGDAHDALYGEVGDLQVVVTKGGAIASSGITPVSLHDPVGDFAYHFCLSDQVETGMAAMIGFNPDPEQPVRFCRGWMVQALPGADLVRFDRIRHNMESAAFRDLLGRAGECPFEELADSLAGGDADYAGLHMEACAAPRFHCTCSREKMAAVVRSLPIPERMELVRKKEDVRIDCHFCNHRYTVTIDECIAAWNGKPV